MHQYCTKFTNLNKINFIESYKVLSYNDYKISEFLKQLKDNPKNLAYFLVKFNPKLADELATSISQQIFDKNEGHKYE